MKSVVMTEEEFKKRVLLLMKIDDDDEAWYPDKEDLYKYIDADTTQNLDFLIWLYLKKNNPDYVDKEARKHIGNLISDNIYIFATEEEKADYKAKCRKMQFAEGE